MADKVEPNKATTLKHETVRGIFLEQSLVFALKHDSRVFIVKLVDERQQEVLILVPCIKVRLERSFSLEIIGVHRGEMLRRFLTYRAIILRRVYNLSSVQVSIG